MMVRHPIAPVVVLPQDAPALEPVAVRYAGPAVAAMFVALKSPPTPARAERPRVEVHVVKLGRRR